MDEAALFLGGGVEGTPGDDAEGRAGGSTAAAVQKDGLEAAARLPQSKEDGLEAVSARLPQSKEDGLEAAARLPQSKEEGQQAAARLPQSKEDGVEGVRTVPLQPRPVTVVDAHYRKDIDLRIVSPVDDFRDLPGDSVWPAVIPQVLELIRQHKTTLVFCNGRRLAERTADRLNEEWAAEAEGRASPLVQDGAATGLGTFAVGAGAHAGPIRAHHGSVSRESRLEMERDLKAGDLPALVATSSLELGIDIGAVDLVVQLQSPRSVVAGLQRVGRSGHLVGQTSRGRFFCTYRDEIVEMAAVAGGMLRGEVEPTYTPRKALDVLAQHIVSMVAVEPWAVEEAYRLLRRAYAYHDLTWNVYLSVLDMLSGRYDRHTRRELQARLVWDRVNDVLQALPGSRMLAVTNGGTIPNRGTFSAYRQDGRVRLGELDEEFVYETRIGDVFMLGSQSWRVLDITEDRLLVADAPGAVPRMPFWHGELPWRPYELGRSGRRVLARRWLTACAGK